MLISHLGTYVRLRMQKARPLLRSYSLAYDRRLPTSAVINHSMRHEVVTQLKPENW